MVFNGFIKYDLYASFKDLMKKYVKIYLKLFKKIVIMYWNYEYLEFHIFSLIHILKSIIIKTYQI
jgi:hypothetical protein